MKKITGASLFIFFCIVTAVLIAGLVFYQDNNQVVKTLTLPMVEKASSTIPKEATSSVKVVKDKPITIVNPPVVVTPSVKLLDMVEVAKHNTNMDCYMVINNKVYDLSGYASSHPGGTRNVVNYCGKESTTAYDTKGRGSPHSSYADGLLDKYYIGDLNQIIK